MPPPQSSHQSAYHGVHAEDLDPPPGLKTFFIRLTRPGGYLGQKSLGGLTDEQFAWVRRCIEAEAQRRETAVHVPPMRHVRGPNGALTLVPEYGQYPLF